MVSLGKTNDDIWLVKNVDVADLRKDPHTVNGWILYKNTKDIELVYKGTGEPYYYSMPKHVCLRKQFNDRLISKLKKLSSK